MISSHRVMVFMDGSNMFWGTKQYAASSKTDFRLDYKKFLEQILAGRSLVRAIFYCSKPVGPITDSQVKFLDYIRSCNIQVVDKDLKERRDKNGVMRRFEKGVDVALATDLLGMAWENAYDTAILISGDADYVGAVSRVMQKGKNVELVSFKGSCSSELRKSVIKSTFVDDFAPLVKL